MSVTAQCTPLFQAVEQQGGQEGYSTCTSSLVALLLHSKQRSFILDTIKSKSFHKNHARRLFSALSPILQHIVEHEEFIPASACHDEEERRISNSNSHSNSEEDLERGSSGAPSHNNRASNASNVTVTPDEESTKALLFIKYTAMMVHAYLVNLSSKHEDTNNNNNNNNSDNNSHKQRSYEIMEEVKEITELLHDVLFDLNSCGVEGLNVQKSIVALCESYWNGHFINRNDYVASVIPLLVVRTLDGNATKADIKRLWNMRDALPLFSFQDESIAYLRSLMVRAVGSGLFIKNAEGRKMISYFFQLDGGLVKDLHEAIKAQIPLAKKSDLLIYGEIYSRAWKEAHADAAGEKEEGEEEDIDDDESFASSSIQATIEDALQELMNASVHVASPHMATSLQSVLDPLLVQKKNPEVDILIYKMYTPFLWRSLSAANPLVRVNASSALSKTFPLRDPNAGKLHLKEVHVKTIDSLLSLLRDEDHKVRVAGCDATIQILGFWWDSLSSTHIRALLNEIVMKHANDATSSAVRAQAVNGISQLLDAKASHGVLRALLPYLGDLIHDRVEKVRLATARLLIKLKTTKNFKFFHTVPKEHLLARLAAEGEGVKVPTGPLAFALSDLLSNSYYPKKAEVSEVVRRTVGFLEENPKAARVFYSNVAYHLEIKSVCKLVKLLLNCVEIGVTREVKKEERSKKRRRNDGSDEDDDGEGEGKSSDYDDLIPTITASNTGLMAEMAATILTLLNSISADLGSAENEKCLSYIQDELQGDVITDICEYFEARLDGNEGDDSTSNDCHSICASLLSCAGFMNLDNRKDLCIRLSNRLETYSVMGTEERRKINIIPYLAVFCSWGMHLEVAQSLSVSIASAFSDDETSSIAFSSPTISSPKRGKRKQVDMNATDNVGLTIPKLPNDVSVHLICKVLRGRDPSSLVIRESILSSEESTSLIANALEKATFTAEQVINSTLATSMNDSANIELIISACESFGRLAVHKEASKDGPLNMPPQASSLLRWLTKRAIPLIVSKNHAVESSTPFKGLNLSRISAIGLRESVSPAPLSPLVLPPPRRRSNMNSTPSKVDSSFASMEHEGGRQFVVDSVSPDACMMVVTLAKSALVVFGEWLAVGGQGVDEIVENIKEWSTIFECKITDIDPRTELLPALCRFGAIAASNYSNYDVLKDILSTTKFEGNAGFEGCVETAIRHLLAKRLTRNTKMNELVAVLMDILSFDDEMHEVESFSDFTQDQREGVRVAMQVLLSSTNGILSFANSLLKKLATSPKPSNHENLLALLYTEHQRGGIQQQLKDCVFRQLGSSGKTNLENYKIVRQALGEGIC